MADNRKYYYLKLKESYFDAVLEIAEKRREIAA